MGHQSTTYRKSGIVSIVEAMGRRYVVKRITKKLKSDGSVRTYYYVYEQYRDGKRVVTRYIAPLEEIVEFYIKYMEANKGNKEWWTGRDLNPGPPGCKPGALPG